MGAPSTGTVRRTKLELVDPTTRGSTDTARGSGPVSLLLSGWPLDLGNLDPSPAQYIGLYRVISVENLPSVFIIL